MRYRIRKKKATPWLITANVWAEKVAGPITITTIHHTRANRLTVKGLEAISKDVEVLLKGKNASVYSVRINTIQKLDTV